MPDFSKQIDLAITEIEKTFGKGAIMKLSDKPLDVDIIPTSSLNLNRALGVGGVPKGRIIEIYGNEASGKTTLATNIMINAQIQDKDRSVAIIDSEHVFDVRYATNQGLAISNTLISQPSCAEEALDIMERLIASQGFSVIVIDSTAALVPQAELEGGFSDDHIALQGRLLSKAMRKITAPGNRTNTTMIFISQMRASINTFGFGPKTIPTGGNSIKYYASQRMKLSKKGQLKKSAKSPFHGITVEVKVEKNKVAPPYTVANMTILYGKGIVEEQDVLDLAIEKGIIGKTGAMLEIDGTKYRGMDAALMFLMDDRDYFNKLREKVLV